MKKRFVLYAHHSKDPKDIESIKAVAGFAEKVVVISSFNESSFGEEGRETNWALEGVDFPDNVEVIFDEINKGLDFGKYYKYLFNIDFEDKRPGPDGWKSGGNRINDLKGYTNYYLINDSFTFIRDPLPSMNIMEESGDFWGYTSSRQDQQEHIQSYFLGFNSFESFKCLTKYLEDKAGSGYLDSNEYGTVVNNVEIPLLSYMKANNFTARSYCCYSRSLVLSSMLDNPTYMLNLELALMSPIFPIWKKKTQSGDLPLERIDNSL